MSNPTKESTKQAAAGESSRWARRTLFGIIWVVIGVLGITTLNGYASSGFTHVPNVFNQLFGSIISPLPKAPPGYQSVTPALLQQDFKSGQSKYLGQNVAVYGKVIPWEDAPLTNINMSKDEILHIKGLRGRSGTMNLALYVDPEEHPEMAARPMVITIRVGDEFLKDSSHEGLQGQWVQVLGQVVAYAPGGGEAAPEIQVSDPDKDIRSINEPADIYDHNIPMPKPGEDED